jgi:multiple antibiotic resistance protein
MQTPGYELGPAEIFTLLFVMIGPLKLLGPFAAGTRSLDEPTLRALAFRATLIAVSTTLVGGFLGRFLLGKWGVGIGALTIAAGVVFFLVALRLVMEEYEHQAAPPERPPISAFETAFPLMVTPYGIAGIIALLSVAQDSARVVTIVGIIFVMLALDLLAMIFVRPILKHLGLPLKLLGAVLAVLMLALSVQLVIDGLRRAGVISL